MTIQLVSLSLWAWLLQSAPSVGSEQRGTSEAAAPRPSPVLQTLLDNLDQETKLQHPQKALEVAERARAEALKNHDAVGGAYAERGRARALEALRRNAEAASVWREVAAAWARLGDGPEQIEALAALALHLESEHPKEAKSLRTEALHLGRLESKRPSAAAQALDVAGRTFFNLLGQGQNESEHVEAAREFWLGALSISERHAPNSLEVAKSLNNLASLAGLRGDLNALREYSQRALAIGEEKAPNSAAVGDSLHQLGNVAAQEGDLAAAGDYYRRALTIRQEKAPDPVAAAVTLNNFGLVAYLRGNLAAAREYCRRAVEIMEEKLPNSVELAARIGNLATVVFAQGDLAAAGEYDKRALAIVEEKAPDTLMMAKTLHNLGNLAEQQEDLVAAGEYYRRSLAIKEKIAPSSLTVAETLDRLGTVALKVGNPAAALDYYIHALVIQEEKAPNSLEITDTLSDLGNVAIRQGDLASAHDYFRRASSLREEKSPSSLRLAESLLDLGKLTQKQGQLPEAKQYFSRAWRLVREQRVGLGGDEAMQAFGTFTLQYAAELIQSQMALGELEAAFTTLEESRAQALQQLLFERSMLAGGIESKAWPVYQTADRARDQAERAFSRATTGEALARKKLNEARQAKKPSTVIAKAQTEHEAAQKQVEAAQATYTEARVRAEEAWSDLKKSAPRAFVAPLDSKQAVDSLPPGTMFIAFVVGDEQTYLFLLRSGIRSEPLLSAYAIERPRQELKRLVEEFRREVATPSHRAEATRAGRLLFFTLFSKEARQRISEARRLLISPDDVLWGAPFAALVTNSQGSPQYLGIQKPIAYAPSLTLFAQARHDPPSLTKGSSPVALVVGDPIFDRQAQLVNPAVALRDPARSERSYLWPDHQRPAPLPGTGIEAARIARLYGATALMQEWATEAAVRQRIGAADVIHLATHGYLHPTRVMSSGILLSIPASEPELGSTDDDGVLQAWEIQSQLKLKAELVVLSACETGRGQVVKGEGLVGLVRALQYAGARSIVTSHWAVNDESTRKLMEAFHRYLRQGQDKDVALQRAMTLLQTGKRTGHPYHWAAFFLTGDPDNPNLGSVAPPNAAGGNRHKTGIMPRVH